MSTPPRAALALPTLRSDLVELRAFSDDDVPLVQDVSSDALIPLITTVPSHPGTSEALAFIGRQHSRAADGTGYSFAIAEPGAPVALGQIGLWLADLREGRASVGYWIAAAHRRRGHAARALELLSAWALELPGLHRLQLYVEPWNEGSWRTAGRAGYRREGLLRSWQPVGDERRDMYMYARVRTDPAQPAG